MEVANVRPIQPTQLWTLDHALSLLKGCLDPNILDALDEYLLLNNTLLMNPRPFHGSTAVPSGLEFSLRNILYTEVTSSNREDASAIAQLLGLEGPEVLRSIVQVCRRVPERSIKNYEKLSSKLPDDREKLLQSERRLLYVKQVVRERRAVLKLVVELLNNKLNDAKSSTIQNLGKNIFLSTKYVDDLIASIASTTSSLIDSSYKTGHSPELDTLIYNESILFLADSLKLLVELLFTNANVSKPSCLAWFSYLATSSPFVTLGPHIAHTEIYSLIEGLATIVSLLFLDLDSTLEVSYFQDASAVDTIHQSLLTATSGFQSNSVLSYAWAVVLLKKSIVLEESPDALFSADKIQSHIAESSGALSVEEVFVRLGGLNRLLRFDNIYASILSTFVIAIVPLVEISPSIAQTIAATLRNAPNSIVEKFYDSDAVTNAIILARAQFPILLSPYLRLASVNGNFAFHEFHSLKSYVALFDKADFYRRYEIDSDDPDLIRTTELIDLYPPFEYNKKLSLLLSNDTKGKILPTPDESKVLVTFLYKYNGWAFLGRVLQNISKIFDSSDFEKVSVVIDIVNLLNKVIEDNTSTEVTLVLEAMSAYTDDSDVIEVILRLFEQALHSRNIDVLEPLTVLLANLVPYSSHRIWPYLSKSSLLPSGGKDGFAAVVFGAVESVKGDYKFTLSLIRLIDSLAQNCLTFDLSYPESSKSTMILRLVSHLIQIFENFNHSQFSDGSQKLEVVVMILDIFSSILQNVYGIDPESAPQTKATKVFADASVRILDAFLDNDSRASIPILNMMENLHDEINQYELHDVSGYWFDTWIRCGFSFAQLLVLVRSNINRKSLKFEANLFVRLPSLVTTYAYFEGLRKSVLDVVTALTNAKWAGETPSLLSHLGKDHAQVLLHSLASDLDTSFDDYKIKISLYDFICAVMDGKQEGLSVLFISGRDVFGETKETKQISLLNKLKKNVDDMRHYPNDVSLHLVDAISLAFNSWTTARESDDDVRFVTELISKIQGDIHDAPELPSEYITACYDLKLVSKISEILSLFLFTTKNDTCRKNIIQLLTSSKFVDSLERRFSIHGFLQQLQIDAEDAFEKTYPSFKLAQFTTSLLKRNRFGLGGIYNFSLMDRLFAKTESWAEVRHQLITSSIHLQYLYSQIAVAKSFGSLITAFCRKSPGLLNQDYLKLVKTLLQINVDEGQHSETAQGRTELAFFVLYLLYNSDVEKTSSNVFEIIKVAAELLSSSSVNFLHVLTQKEASYRSLLRIVYITLSLVKDDFELIVEYSSVFRDLFELIITKGTRNILIDVQNAVYLSKANNKDAFASINDRLDDLHLILSILKVFMQLRTSQDLHHTMAQLAVDNGTIKALLNLFSYAHLVEVNDEPVFAQLSLMFIQQFLQIDLIAQQLFTTGLLVVLVQSTISQPIRKGGVSIQATPQYHGIWSSGLLPIFIGLLTKLGPNILSELLLAIQAYKAQIEFCVESWAKDSSSIKISSALILETSQILLLLHLVKAMSGHYTEHVDSFPALNTDVKRDEFVDYVKNLLKHPKFLSSRIIPSSPDEERLIEQDQAAFSKAIIADLSELVSLAQV